MLVYQDTDLATDPIGAAQHKLVEKLTAHPFLCGCRNGAVTRTQLNRLLVQHAKYGAHFTRYLSALMSNLRSGDDCIRLAANLIEEAGLTADSGTPHSRLFLQMLDALGVDPASEPLYPETQNLIDTMYLFCRHSDAAYGLGALCLGAEAIVPSLYSDLIAGFVNVGVPLEQLHFFTIHIDCDDGHADSMRDIMRRIVDEYPGAALMMTSAGEAAINARLRLFDRLHAGEQQ